MERKKYLDVRGHACPMPIIKTSIALRTAQRGEVLEVVADDSVFRNDIKAWCEKTNNILESIDVSGEETRVTIIKN